MVNWGLDHCDWGRTPIRNGLRPQLSWRVSPITLPPVPNGDFYGNIYKKGYLNSEFRLFHLTDRETQEVAYHYHDFDKITIFIKGSVSYMIEGKSYDLKPYDIVLVRHGDIHRLSVDNSKVYERIIVYISPNFMDAYHTDSYDLSYCFHKAELEHSNVLRIPSLEKSSLFRAITRLEQSFSDNGYAAELYRQVLFLEFMIHLNRAARKTGWNLSIPGIIIPRSRIILAFINENLSEDLSIDRLSGKILYQQILYDETIQAGNRLYSGAVYHPEAAPACKELILSGVPGTQACFDCGFRDYSTFSRAYKKQFQESPRETLTFS